MANPMAPKAAFHRAFASAVHHVRCYSAPAGRVIPAAKQKYVPTSGEYPKGFLVGTSHASVKASNTEYDDVTMIVSEKPCVGAAVFTRNIFKAAPVIISRDIFEKRQQSDLRGAIINSGCANAVTGKLGLKHATQMATKTDELFGKADSGLPQTMVMSTGVIGQHLPIERIDAAIPKAHEALGSTHEHWLNGAKAICTTDTFPKLISRTFILPSHPDTEYRIAGMTKGAGMIHPNMGTLLGVICTDAAVDKKNIQHLLKTSTDRSFNMISIDGDTSTNDTVALFANGAATPADQAPLAVYIKGDKEASSAAHEDGVAFLDVLRTFMEDLAKLVVRDGEGATKFVTLRVRSDRSYEVAKAVAASIAQSSLVKTALYGKDANWGRILCAIGYTPDVLRDTNTKNNADPVQPERTSVSFIPSDGSEELKLLVRGEPEAVDESRAKEILEMDDLEILVRLDDNAQETTDAKAYEVKYWTCDFSHEYVTINGDYRT